MNERMLDPKGMIEKSLEILSKGEELSKRYPHLIKTAQQNALDQACLGLAASADLAGFGEGFWAATSCLIEAAFSMGYELGKSELHFVVPQKHKGLWAKVYTWLEGG